MPLRQDGFTLIELLVAIGIIAVLIAVLLPGLQRARSQARTIICQGRLRQWSMVLAAYTQDHQGRLPSDVGGLDGVWLLRGAFLTGEDPNAPQDSFHHFHTQKITCCPRATKPLASPNGRIFRLTRTDSVPGSPTTNTFGAYTVSGTRGAALSAWEITTPAPAFRGSYGFNQCLFQGFHMFGMARLQTVRYVDVLSLPGRGNIPVLLDAIIPVSAPMLSASAPMGPDGGSARMAAFVTNRHGAFTNALLLDWSVRKAGLKELWTLKWSDEFDTAGPRTKAGGVQPEDWPEWMRDFKDY